MTLWENSDFLESNKTHNNSFHSYVLLPLGLSATPSTARREPPKLGYARFGEPLGAVPLPDHYRGASRRLRKTRLGSLAFVGLRLKKRLLTVFSSLTSRGRL